MKIVLFLFLCAGCCNQLISQVEDAKTQLHTSILNQVNLDQVKLRSKVELGIQVPKKIAQLVRNFTENRDGEKLNPFLEWELKVFAEFTHVETGEIVKIDGFYYQEFLPYMVAGFPDPKNGLGYSDEEYRKLGGYSPVPGAYAFRVRFAPMKSGAWNFKVYLQTEIISTVSGSQSFTVSEEETSEFLEVGSNGRYLSLGNETYYPMGCNLPWPQTSVAYDPEFTKKLSARWWSGRVGPKSEQYRTVKVLPRVYDKYIEHFNLLSDSGINMIRMIMYPSGTEIEYEQLGNYTARLPMAQEMDRIIENAENRGVQLIWNLQIHYTYQYAKSAYGSSWTWDREIDGAYNCYHELLGDKSSPIEFFTDETCRKYYKQRLRYLIARYGYSTSLGIFELFSEISNVGTEKADHSEFYQSDENWKIFKNWQVEMAEYINTQHNGKIHPLTSSFAGEKHPDDILYESNALGVMSSNIYSFGSPPFADFWIDKIAKRHLNESEDSYCSYTGSNIVEHNIKPLIYSETDPVIIEAVCDDLSPEFSRFYWQAAFSGIAAAVSWSLSGEVGDFSVFKSIDEFIDGYDFDGGHWHPGASKMIVHSSDSLGEYRSWEFEKKYAEKMAGSVNPRGLKNKRRERHADLMYLRNGELDRAIGVVTNKTYNAYFTDSNFRKLWIEKSNPGLTTSALLWRKKPFHSLETANLKSEKLRVMGLRRGKYIVEYYYANDAKKVVATQEARGKNLKLDFPELTPDASHYILLFKTTRVE